MAQTDPAIGAEARPHWRHGFTLAVALLAVLLAWVPGLGLLLSLAALGMGIWGLRHHARPRSSSWAVAFAVVGILLGGTFTGLYVFLAPARETPEERETWEAFDRLFSEPEGSPVAPGGAGGQPGP
ncbi:hypothetical protein [Vulgatibacter sp.]|uniref:hypothetical protein n=1 Tax=Vulgatibacter sp. TaxID=1971226 RepID=UPI0035667420